MRISSALETLSNQTCTKTFYVHNTTAWLIGLPKEQRYTATKKPTLRRLGRLPLVCGRPWQQDEGEYRGVRPGAAAVEATTHDLNYEYALSHPVPYIIGDMDSGRYSIEIEPEVRLWLENISAHH